LEQCGLQFEVGQVNREAVRCARAGSKAVPVIGSIGPSGAEPENWDRLFSGQCEALAEEKIDGYIVETIVAIDEGVAAVRAAVRTQAGAVIASFTPGSDGDLLDGTPVETACKLLLAEGAGVVGVNCGAGPESLFPAISRLARLEAVPVFAAPNAGIPARTATGLRHPLRPDSFARAAIEFQEIGVRMLAGCCGTTPEHIRAAVAALRVLDPGERH
jgi:methionine synthase I (cobalamin-dependent)